MLTWKHLSCDPPPLFLYLVFGNRDQGRISQNKSFHFDNKDLYMHIFSIRGVWLSPRMVLY